MLNLRAVLTAADFSASSEDAFRVARALARDYGARLVVLHVATPPPLVTPGELQLALERPHGYRAELEKRLRLVYAADSPAGVAYEVELGEPALEILKAARELGCDLIVMGTHGRTGVGRLLMGSVAEQVVRQATCPVLTVKTPLTTDFEGVPAALDQVSESPLVRRA